MDNFWKAVVVTCCLFSLPGTDADAHDNNQSRPELQTKLLKELLSDYHKGVPPIHTGPVVVNLDFTLLQFEFTDERSGKAAMHAWSSRYWNDPRLQWDPEAYNGTEKMVMDAKDIWLPDIVFMDSGSVTHTLDSNVIVTSDGNVVRHPSCQIEFKCSMHFKFFPYDEQSCSLRFGSWHYQADTINLTAKGDVPDLSTYYPSDDFLLTSAAARRHVMKYRCCPETYLDVTYYFNFKRRSNAYGTKLVLPSVLTGFMILATFLLPPASHEKITLCGLIFLSLLLQLTYLHDIIPMSGDTILGEYLAFALFVDLFATIMATVSYNVNSRSSLMQTQKSQDAEGDNTDLQLQIPKKHKMKFLPRYLDVICFVLFSIVFIVGLAIILSRRGKTLTVPPK